MPCGEQFWREIVRPARLDVGASAKKFAQRAENTPKLVFFGLLGEFFRGSAAGGAVLGELFRGCGPGRLVSCGMCSVLPQCANLGGTRGGCCGCMKEAAKARGAVAHANLCRPTGTPCAASCGALWNTSADLHRSRTQRMQERPGPWPRALPATHALRQLPEQLHGVRPDHERCQDHRRAETHAKAANHVRHPVDAQVQARHANKHDERQRRGP